MKNSASRKQNTQVLAPRTRLWTPHNLPHLIAWYSLSTIERETADGTHNKFLDVSGNGNDLENLTSAQFPTVKVSSNFGNFKVLDFDGSNDLLKVDPPPDSLDIGDGDFFFCAAIAADAADANQTIMSLQRQSNDEELRLFLTSAGVFTFRIIGTDTASATGNLEGSVNIVYAERINGSMKVYVNGTIGNKTDTSTLAIDNNTATILGALNTSGQQIYDGQIGEVVYGGSTTKGIMDDFKRQRLEGYIAHRHKISSRLAATHPFRHGPPKI